MSILWFSLVLSLQNKVHSCSPVHANQPFSALLGHKGHSSPSQSFHHPRSQLLVFLYAMCAYSLASTFLPAPVLPGPAKNKNLITGASSCTTDLAETILLQCYPSHHPHQPSTAQHGAKASSQLVSTSHQGMDMAPPAARCIFSACSAVAAPAQPLHNVLTQCNRKD